jgi:tRNA G37 N-methylase Trm5
MAKKQPEVNKIYSVELNPDAHYYAQGNIVLNKLQNKVEAVLMDAVVACNTVSRYLFPHIYSLIILYIKRNLR